jgi:hypothetical protein
MSGAMHRDVLHPRELVAGVCPNLMPQRNGIFNELFHMHMPAAGVVGLVIGIEVSDLHFEGFTPALDLALSSGS